jgi:lipopolysaccharide export system ATP-binding protein
MLKIKNLKKSYNNKCILSDLSFEIKKGEIVGLLGPNGAGKTTAFYIAIGLIAPDFGKIYFQDVEVTELPIHKRAKMGMGYLSQEPSIFRTLSVEDNIMAILELMPINKIERKKKLEILLQELNLEKLRKKKAMTLSGGERRRLEITRAQVTEPKLLLLDEPFANIDPIAIQDLKKLINHLKQKKISVLITDHNAREIFSIVDRAYIISDGKVLIEGSVKKLMNNPIAKKYYLGEDFHI